MARFESRTARGDTAGRERAREVGGNHAGRHRATDGTSRRPQPPTLQTGDRYLAPNPRGCDCTSGRDTAYWGVSPTRERGSMSQRPGLDSYQYPGGCYFLEFVAKLGCLRTNGLPWNRTATHRAR